MEYFIDSKGTVYYQDKSVPTGFVVNQTTGKFTKVTSDFRPYQPTQEEQKRAEAIANQTSQTRVTPSSKDGANTGRLPERTRVVPIMDGGVITGYNIVGISDPNKVYGEIKGDGTQSQAELIKMAYARQQQLVSGSTPTVAGRPDLYVIDPLPGENKATITGPNGEQVTPRVATKEEIQQSTTGQLQSFNEAYAPKSGAGATNAANGGGAGSSAAANDAYTAIENSVTSKENAATSANPDLVVTPEMRAQWVKEAEDELSQNRYYAELFKNTEADLGTSFSRIAEDFAINLKDIQTSYGRNLETTQANLQDQGMLYGGVRAKAERQLAQDTQSNLDKLNLSTSRSLQDLSTAAERNLGSDTYKATADKLGSFNYAGRVLAGTPTFTTGSPTASLTYTGGQYGDINRSIQTEIQTRAAEKETAFRDITSQYA